MPQTQPFSAFGKYGSGFPVCLEKIDVSLYNYSNPMTLEQLGTLFWNLHGVNIDPASLTLVFDDPETGSSVDFTTIQAPQPEPVISVEPFQVGMQIQEEWNGSNWVWTIDNFDVAPEPGARVCGYNNSFRWVFSDGQTQSVTANLKFNQGLSKLYDGDTSDESNFVGYGYDMHCLALTSGQLDNMVNQVSLGNYAELTDWVDPSPPGFNLQSWWDEMSIWYGMRYTDTGPDTVSNVTIDGIPFVQAQWTGRDTSFGGVTWTVPTPSDGFFDFYSYP